jgi:Phage tail lysozyme
MSQEEVLRMVATARDQASGPLRKVENALRGLGKSGGEQSRQLRESFKGIHESLRKVSEVAKEGAAPAIEAIGISSLSAVAGMAALVNGLKNFVDQGDDVAAFGRKVQLTTDTVRGLEGVGDKFHVDPGAIRQGLQGFTDAMYQFRRHQGAYAHLSSAQGRLGLANELADTPETMAGNEAALKKYLKLLEDVKRVHGEPTARAFSKEMTGTDAFVDLLRKGNAGLEEAIALTLQLRGNMDTAASERWVSNWSNFKATIEGIRNEIGNDLLPDLTESAKQAQRFFSEHHARIGRDIAEAVRKIAGGLRDVVEFLERPSWDRFKDMLRDGDEPLWSWDNVKKNNADLRWAPYYTHPKIPIGRGGDSGFAESFGGVPGSGAAASIIQGLRDRGLDASHAAVLAGNIEQESGFDPTRPNVAEGGIGLLQWNKERREALRALAAKKHKLETDAGVQMDFIMQELNETPQGRAFLGAQGLDAENRELHRHIRYGDNSEGRRLMNARNLFSLAERPTGGSLLAAAAKSGLGGAATTVTGSASLDINIKAPPGTSVRANADGLFDRVQVNRGFSLKPPLSSDD